MRTVSARAKRSTSRTFAATRRACDLEVRVERSMMVVCHQDTFFNFGLTTCVRQITFVGVTCRGLGCLRAVLVLEHVVDGSQ